MQSPTRPSDRQAAIFVSVAVGIVVAVITTATFWWIYSLTLGPERAATAAALANAPRWSPSDGAKVITAAQPNAPTDGRKPWLGQQAWTEGVQAGQAWITMIPTPANAQVLKGLTSAEIWTYMVQYVSGGLGVSCQYCHDITNFAADTFPQKLAARSMFRMVSDVNAKFITTLPNWRGNYLQCATCHNSAPQNLETVSPQFIKSVPPIQVTVDPLDETGTPITDPAKKPEAIRDQVALQDAVLFYIYNYQVWKPFDGTEGSGRGSLALTYEGGRTQDQVTINQNVMNNHAWSLGVGCTFCHNSRNFVAFELNAAGNLANPVYGYNKLKAQQMMQLTTYLAQNWPTYGAIAKTAVPTALEGGASAFSYQTLSDGQIYNTPGCYTCHRGVNVPLGSLNQASVPAGAAGNVSLPPVLRGTQ
ncbi:MAG: photosynthetic reaction center cytochrome c subunit [Chloroflexales bacterium]|nr:photosynthetic reaction center cytochrome c subunit [Chloroflexales bacterium]